MPMTVLLVEDSSADARLIREAFRDADESIALHVASNGVHALAFLKHEGAYARTPFPDLILLDLNMPAMDGRKLLTHIKDHEIMKGIPTIILTGSVAEADIENGYELQASCYLLKPPHWDGFKKLAECIIAFWLTKPMMPRQIEVNGRRKPDSLLAHTA